jgi:hypothetical protein
LAVLNNYINANNVEFTEQEESKILVPADLAEKIKLEEQEKERLQKAEDEARVIQETLGKIDTQTKEVESCIFYWRKETQGGTKGAYFLLANTNDFKSIIFATKLAKGVFVDNPTPRNQTIRNIYNMGFLQDMNLGVIAYEYPSLTTKENADVNSQKGNQEEVLYYLNKITTNANPTLLVFDDNRVGGDALLTDMKNPNGLVKGWNVIQDKGYLMTHVINTLMMVAWAEGIDLSIDVYDDFFALAECYQDAITYSVQFKERAYIVLTRETDTEESELLIRYGTASVEDLIKEKGADNAFVVAIVVDGAFQDGINPYMFSAKAQTATLPPPPISPQQIAEASALKTSQFTTENVYVVRKKNGSFEVVVGESNVDNAIKSSDFLRVVEVFNDGVSTASKPTQVTLKRGKSITQAELDAIEKAKLEAFVESNTTSENVYAIQKQDDSFVIKVGETEAYKIIHSTDFQSVVGVYKLGKEINIPLLPPPTTTQQYAIPSTEPSTWDAVFDIGDKVKVRLDFSNDMGDGSSKVDYNSAQNSFTIAKKSAMVGLIRPENLTGVLYTMNNGQSWEGKDLEFLTTTENEPTDWEVAGMSKEEWDTRDKAIEASKITTEKCYVVKLKDGTLTMEVGDENVINLVDTDQFEELIAVYKDGYIVASDMPIPKPPKETISFTKDVLMSGKEAKATMELLQKGLLQVPELSVISDGKTYTFKSKDALVSFLYKNTSIGDQMAIASNNFYNIPKGSTLDEIKNLLVNVGALKGVGKTQIFNRKRAKERSEETDVYVYVVKLQNGDYGIAEGDGELFAIENAKNLSEVVASYLNGAEVMVKPKRVYATESPEIQDEVIEELTEEDLKDLPPIELHIKNKDALKTDFSLLEDINFDDEE